MPHYISSLGRYKDFYGVVKTPSRNKAGYGRIQIQNKTYYTHRVVAIAFGLPRRPGQTQVNHINRVPGDDKLENLEWATPAENIRHSRATNPDRKSSAPKQSKPVRGRTAGSDEPWTSYPSAHAAARALQLKQGSVRAVVSGRCKKTGGFEFEYDEPTEPGRLEGEVWKPFLTAQVSNMGRYKNYRGVVSTPTPHPNGYVPIGVDGKHYAIHRAIGVAFGLLTGLDDERQIDHEDNDPSNNNLANLRAVTGAENVQHSYDTNTSRGSHVGKQSKPIRGRKCGEKEWTAYASAHDAARQLELNHGNISAVLSGGRKQTGGHEFELAEARESACLAGERWVEIDVEKLRIN